MMNNRARLSGRQKMNPILSPAKAGSTNFLETVPRAALRFTSFRCNCPGLNSAAGDAGWLNDSHLKLISFSVILVILAFLTSCNRTASESGAPALTPSPQPVSSSLDVVKIETDSVAIAVGGNANGKVVLAITPGFHINANPATFPYLISTTLEVGNGYGMITAGKPVYPAAQTREFQFAEKPLAVYQGEV